MGFGAIARFDRGIYKVCKNFLSRLQKGKRRQRQLPEELTGHVGHPENPAQPVALAHKDVIDIFPAASQTLEVAAALGENHVGAVQGVLERRAQEAGLGAGNGGPVVQNGDQGVHAHIGGVLPGGVVEGVSPRTQ